MTTTQDAGAPRPVATLEMVAALAGVSRATVSRVVNDSPSVDPELALSVKKAILALDYTPNRAARSLAKRRAQAVTLIVPESTSKVFADPFFASVVQGIALFLTDTEYTLNMVISSESKPEKTRSFLLGGNVDGVLVVSHHSSDHSWTHLSGSLPMVFAGRPLVGSRESYYVEVDNERAAYSVTRQLTDSGRRHVATIAGPQDMPPGIDRLAGWRTAVVEAGLSDGLVEVGDFTLASGARAMHRLLDRGTPLDAVFAGNDQMAAGAYTAIQGRGLRIPEDIAVVGFDDDSFATSVTPALTTVHHPIIELGKKMAEILVDLIEGRPAQRATMLPTSLVIRDSA
ncbi:LacI family DNA-binding transcriptional regulator [Arthrobacter sp. MDT2-16]|uniref:LacI family DNA-binding transcriptional regulator n=1 Tax=Arthrobacter ruber TaxID=1258893 RepID=UPI000CF39E1E|nr:LacI family DNA-binding transcriptional regulator [Arthrobacter ruber]